MKPLTLSLVIPAHNEAKILPRTISSLVTALEAAEVPHEIVVIDDHSSDETARVVEVLGRRFPTVRVVSNERPTGFGHAVHTGLDAYKGDAVCVVMPDGCDEPRDVVDYYRKLLEGHECVFGSRFVPGASIANYPKHKLLPVRLANFFIRLLFGLPYNDITNAFKCYRRTVVDGIRPILSHHFNLNVELPLKAIVRGYSYTVIPTHWDGRHHRVSKLRIREMGKRYLFIVLCVLLERVLCRADYERADRSEVLPSSGLPARRPGWAWLAFAAVVAVHALFVYTYPLNSGGGDTPGYYHVLINRTSNLAFAPGYPVLASLPLRLDWYYNSVLKDQASFRFTLLLAQHVIEVACLLVLLVALNRLYNRFTAVIAVVFIGCSPRALGVTSSVYPEWLEADLLILSLALAAFAYSARAGVRKHILYSLSLAAFTWCVLVKFNSIVFAPVLLACFLFERVSWRQRAALLFGSGLFAFANLIVLLVGFHRPATGTFALTHDRSWVLMTKLSSVYGNNLPYPEGLHSKRWLALSSVLPPNYSVASVGIFMKLDSVPASVREPARADAAFLLTADEDVVDGVLQMHRLPGNFRLGVSSIPISYYIGLAESDELGVRVFRESVFHRPGPFIRSMLRGSLETVTVPSTESTFPTLENVSNVTERLVPVGSERYRLVRQPDSPLPFDSPDPVIIWGRGYRFFSRLNALPIRRTHVVVVMALGLMIAIWHGLRFGWSVRAATPVLLWVCLVALVLFSNALLGFRWKEWRCALPVVGVLVAIGVGWGIPEVIRAAGRVVSQNPERKGVSSSNSFGDAK
jgi:dolichol-phosphate mannosyltransferase